MPYKCMQCNHVAQDKDDQVCCPKPHYLKVPTIHYAHEMGKGELFCTTVRSEQRVRGKAKQQEVTTDVQLFVACHEEECCGDVHIIPDTVTCPQCLQFISELGVADEVFVQDPEDSTIKDVENDSN